MGSRFRQVRARMVAVPPHEPTAQVGYVINQHQRPSSSFLCLLVLQGKIAGYCSYHS